MLNNIVFAEIERLRSEMNALSSSVVCYQDLLKISQKVDRLIVLYYKIAS